MVDRDIIKSYLNKIKFDYLERRIIKFEINYNLLVHYSNIPLNAMWKLVES